MRFSDATFIGKRKTKSGEGLLETVLYVAIVVLLTVIVVNTATVMLVSSSKARLKRNVLGEAGIAAERIVREIRLAENLDMAVSVLGAHPGVLKLNTTVSSSDTTPTTREFYLSGGTLMIKEGGGNPLPLTRDATITRLVFYHAAASTTSELVSFELSAEDEVKNLREAHDFNGSAVLRGSY